MIGPAGFLQAQNTHESGEGKERQAGRDVPAALGVVRYDVRTECPHCGKRLALNQYPYDDETTEYSLAEDDLGLALFGTDREPARWTGLDIEYRCCACGEPFRIAELEI